jgi:serine phosphatase RsbU (regulator of sigma subunit)
METERRRALEMERAKQVQSRLFPQEAPRLRTLDYVGVCMQASAVGGDYYDFIDLGLGRVGFVLADVSGKGVPAALLMANLQAILCSHYAAAREDLLRLLESVNRLLYKATADDRFATLFIGNYDDATRRLRYANCGHNPPLLLRKEGAVERLTATATVLGIFEEWESTIAEVQLGSDDTLVLFSDGVTEAMTHDGEEFGVARLLEALCAHRHLPAPGLLNAIVTAVRQFSGSEQRDDLSLVVARAR